MAPVIKMKTGDTAPIVRHRLTDASGQGVDLNGATVQFIVATKQTPRQIRVEAEATVTQVADGSDGTKGNVQYVWQAGDTDSAGSLVYEWEVTFADGKIQTFPTDNQGQCSFVDDLGGTV